MRSVVPFEVPRGGAGGGSIPLICFRILNEVSCFVLCESGEVMVI